MTPRTVQLKKLEDDRGGGSGSGEMKCYHHYNDQGPEHDTYCGVPPKCQERVGKEFKDLDKCPY